VELKNWQVRQYYEQDELIEKVMELAEYREVVPTYPKGYGKRPDAVNFPGDFQQFVENGAVAFHFSVEKWRNPLLIDQVSSLDRLRETWDMVIDIDCDESFELSKKTCELVVRELQHHGIENLSVKFSGNRGFHIGIRGESFPERIGEKEFSELYPRLAQGIVNYLRKQLREKMIAEVKKEGLHEEMKTEDGLNPYQVADIENDWGQRHLFRMPYSLHDGSGLVSLPIEPEDISSFEKRDAEIEKINFETGFLDSYEDDEATNLAVQALDFIQDREEEKREKRVNREFERPEDAIPEQYFPPTIKNILNGLEDGRKRGLFILINFYRCVGYGWAEIESKIWEWNERNNEELSESYVKGQLRWHQNRSENVPPPNYDANGYYKDMQVYEGDNLENKVSNPVSYAFRKAKKREPNNEENDNFVCEICGKEYKIESYYKKHVQQCFE